MRDKQKSKVYNWQDDIADFIRNSRPELFAELPMGVCQGFVERVCASYGAKSPQCIPHRSAQGATAHYQHWSRTITLPDGWARNARTVAHEVAHAITHHLYPEAGEAHGKEFMRVYIDIMANFLMIDRGLLERSAVVQKLQVLEPRKI